MFRDAGADGADDVHLAHRSAGADDDDAVARADLAGGGMWL